MKALTLASSLIAALSLSAFGQSDTSLRSQISLKEKELVELQKELTSLRSRLSSSTTNSASYTVKTGDTVSSIARRSGVSAADLTAWNKITDPTRLRIGEVLTIKGVNTDVSQAPKAVRINTPTPASTSDYTIVIGDTFYSIARTHKLSVTQLRDLNPDVSTHLITAGQKLRVSSTPAASVAKSTPRKSTPIATEAPEVKKTVAQAPKVTPPVTKKATIETKTSKNSTATFTPAPKTETPAPTPKMEAVVAVKKETSAPPTPPAPPVVKEEKAASKASVASIILMDETTFDAFATKHGTNTEQLNALNGWNLPSATVLARGSEIYVPQ
ncbi:MAG: LysM peptidoglycan-binding domain-containing protein [Akkermansiaceae bacterium]|jgi:LysM repeat protein